MLDFHLTQAEEFLKQHHSTMGESRCMLNFHLTQEQVQLEQHHSTMGEI
jgi:hypothetical protein